MFCLSFRFRRYYPLLPLANGWSPSAVTSVFWRYSATTFLFIVVFLGLLNITILHTWLYPQPPGEVYDPLTDYRNLKSSFAIGNPSAPRSSPTTRAVVSSLYNDFYTIPIAVLGHSISQQNIAARRILMYIPGRLSERSLCIVRAAGWELHTVNYIPPPNGGKGVFYRFVDQFTKLNLWRLDELGIKSAVYLDGDTLVRHDFTELFDLPFDFAAVPDVYVQQGFTTSFNAGMIFLRPSTYVFKRMMAVYQSWARYPLGEAEQGFLNLYFAAEAVRLSYFYNGNLSIRERSIGLWNAIREEVKIVHYAIVRPFSKEPTPGITTAEGLERTIQDAKSQQGGRYAAEIGWWEDAWRDMEQLYAPALAMCAMEEEASQ